MPLRQWRWRTTSKCATRCARLQFASRQRLAAELERAFPGRFIPRYSMVMFHPEIPYAEAQRRGAVQQRLLDALAARYGYQPLQPAALDYARGLLDTAGL